MNQDRLNCLKFVDTTRKAPDLRKLDFLSQGVFVEYSATSMQTATIDFSRGLSSIFWIDFKCRPSTKFFAE